MTYNQAPPAASVLTPPNHVGFSAPDKGATSALLAFVSLARVATGEAILADVLALASRLVGDLAPGASGAWFVPTPLGDRLVAADAFGPAAHALRGASIAVGERLTGWVAARLQSIVNAPANLDLGSNAELVEPALATCTSVPLMADDALVGVLSVYGTQANDVSEDLGRLLQMVAPQLAAAIDASAPAATIPEIVRATLKEPSALRLVSTR